MDDIQTRQTPFADKPVSVVLLECNPGEVLRFKQILAGDKRRPDFQITHLSTLAIAENYVGQEQGLHVTVTALNLPDGRGLEVVKRLREANPLAPLVVLHGLHDALLPEDILRAGASYCLEREQLVSNLTRVLNLVLQPAGQTVKK